MTNNNAFLGINLDLLENPKYKDLDPRAMMLYALYADRYSCSLNNARLGNTTFVDNTGVFIRMTNEFAAKVLHLSDRQVGKLRKQLESYGLIKIVRDGLKGYKIYVNQVNRTASNVERILPWKNHNITVKREYSTWTVEYQLRNAGKNLGPTVSAKTNTTDRQKESISLSQSSLSQVNNYNGLVDSACARKGNTPTKLQAQSANPYHSLPEKIKKSFADVFGFITKPMAIELHSLIDQSNEDMVEYVISSSKGHKITNSIAYIKAAITNAVKRGAKCVQDMVNYYNENEKKSQKVQKQGYKSKQTTKNSKYTQQELDILLNNTEEEIRVNYPALFLKRLKSRVQEVKSTPTLIPIYKLGE